MSAIFVKDYNAPALNESEALRYAGVRSADEEIEKLFEECADEAWDKLTYKVCWAELPVGITDDGVMLGDVRLCSKALRENLSGCSCVIVFAATIGIGIDRLVARHSVSSPAKALMLQGLGAERIESLCDAFESDVRRDAMERGLSVIGRRFSPGYSDLPLESQKELFAILDCSKKIGVSLNESLMMSPSKSVTAIIGLGASENGCSKNKCDSCQKLDCEFRRK